jgi:hypothetical protein
MTEPVFRKYVVEVSNHMQTIVSRKDVPKVKEWEENIQAVCHPDDGFFCKQDIVRDCLHYVGQLD